MIDYSKTIFFFTCVKCNKKRRQSVEERTAGLSVCRVCRSGPKVIKGQRPLFKFKADIKAHDQV